MEYDQEKVMLKICNICKKKIRWYHDSSIINSLMVHNKCVKICHVCEKKIRWYHDSSTTDSLKLVHTECVGKKKYHYACRCGEILRLKWSPSRINKRCKCPTCKTVAMLHNKEKYYSSLNKDDDIIVGKLIHNADCDNLEEYKGGFIICPICDYNLIWEESKRKFRCKSCWARIEVKEDNTTIEVIKHGGSVKEAGREYPLVNVFTGNVSVDKSVKIVDSIITKSDIS